MKDYLLGKSLLVVVRLRGAPRRGWKININKSGKLLMINMEEEDVEVLN
jgi:hypothetical protein